MMRGKCNSHLRLRSARTRQWAYGLANIRANRFFKLGACLLALSSCQTQMAEQEPVNPQRERIHIQRATAYMIESLGGDAVYDFEDFDGGNVPDVRPERELVDRLFESSNLDELPKIIFAELEGKHVGDNELMLVHYLPDLVGLTISDIKLVDSGFAERDGMARHFPTLPARNSGITDSGMVQLQDLTRLRKLWLAARNVRGPGLAYFSSLPLLESLNLFLPSLENDGLSHLQFAANLQIFHLSSLRITDEGVPYLAQIPKLTTLSIGNTSITGAGLRHLRSCEQLTNLGLSGRQLTREGIEQLILMTNLRVLWTFSQVDPELEAELRRARPDLRFSLAHVTT